MAMGGLVSAAVSIFHNSTALPMLSVMMACALAGLVILLISKRDARYRASQLQVEEDTSVVM